VSPSRDRQQNTVWPAVWSVLKLAIHTTSRVNSFSFLQLLVPDRRYRRSGTRNNDLQFVLRLRIITMRKVVIVVKQPLRRKM